MKFKIRIIYTSYKFVTVKIIVNQLNQWYMGSKNWEQNYYSKYIFKCKCYSINGDLCLCDA